MKNQLKIIQSMTDTETRSVGLYLNDISRLSRINAADEALLAARMRQGDRSACERLVNANLRFVVSVAKQYQHKGLPLADLIAEGNMGLLAAARKYDETRGFKFISYAVWHIRQHILDAISDDSRTIRLPQNQSDTFRDLQKAAAAAEQALERHATPEELSSFSGIPQLQVDNALYYNQRISSLYTATGIDEEDRLIDRLRSDEPLPDEGLENGQAHGKLYGRLTCLPERERRIIRLSFGLDGGPPMQAADIAPVMRLSTERVRQLKIRAMVLLRRLAEGDGAPDGDERRQDHRVAENLSRRFT